MVALGASKVSLSTLSSQDLWKRTTRIRGDGSGSPEIFKIQDRKDANYILSPTHEEEITSLVGSIVKSYKDLPLKLYQITRKYRDEARPRQGLLRTREFLMKDLYTFDVSQKSALKSYETVRKAYSAFFEEFKIPYLVAEAASGEMGGDLSHEFHFPTTRGEDNVVSCDNCDYVANEELAKSACWPGFVNAPDAKADALEMLLQFASTPYNMESADGLYRQWFGYSKDGALLYQVIYPTRKAFSRAGLETSEESRIDLRAVQQAFGDSNLTVESPHRDSTGVTAVHRLYDATIVPPSELLPDAVEIRDGQSGEDSGNAGYLLKSLFTNHVSHRLPVIELERNTSGRGSLLKIRNGDRCAKCMDGRLKVQPAVELGHTFYLGSRYSTPLDAKFAIDPSQKDIPDAEDLELDNDTDQAFMQMGCHGIGVSRLIAAVADALVDSKGLNWPRVVAPFEAVVVPTKAAGVDAQTRVYDTLTSPQKSGQGSIDVILDDRQRDFGWKLTDADMIGYPVIVVIGRGWKEQKCEVQCRRLGVRQEVHLQELKGFVEGLLDML